MKSFNSKTNSYLQKKRNTIKLNLFEYTKKNSSFLGSCLSCLDILIYLYYFKYDLSSKNKFRSRFILSKGHAAPTIYSILFDKKIIFKKKFLSRHVYWHPNKNIKTIDFQTGALGHGLPVSIGMAKFYLKNKSRNKIITLLGDGELNEGSVWESLFLAINWKLNNLIIIVDKNKFQANEKTSKVMKINNEKQIFKNLGFQVLECNGHSFKNINDQFKKIKNSKPVIVIANTIRNYGIKEIQNKKDYWFFNKIDKKISLLKN